tara:strand:- start:170 stop:781 length:612 start_codon:yes stop_codon:yes gene_type:complete
MVLKYIKSIWQSNSTSQVKTNLTTFINTTVEQLQDWKPLLKEGIAISFISLVNLITISLLLITSLVILCLILIYGLATFIGKTGDDTYKQWSKKVESLHYYYEQDIDYIIDRMNTKDIKFNDLFLSVDGQHPTIVKMFLSKKINFETLIILDDILKFTKRLNKDITEKVLWPKLFDRMKRYKPFLSYNITKYKISLRDKLKEI